MKYQIARNWILRKDLYLEEKKYTIFSIETGKELNINGASFALLSMLSIKPMSLMELNEALSPLEMARISEEDLKVFSSRNIISEVNSTSIEPDRKYDYLSYTEKIENQINFDIPVATTPKMVEIHFTEQCNIKCVYCGYDVSTQKCKTIDKEHWVNVFDELEEMKIQSAMLSGGEPSLYKDFDYLMEDLKKRSIKITLFTNGMMIHENNVKSLVASNITTAVSLDGSTANIHEYYRGSNSFKKAMNGIKLLAENGANFYISSTIGKNNMTDIENIIEICKEYGAKSLALSKMLTIGRAHESEEILSPIEEKIIENKIELYNKENLGFRIQFSNELFFENHKHDKRGDIISCPAGTTRFTINSDGAVYPCVLNFHDNNFKVGNIQEEKIIDLWTNNKWKMVRNLVKTEDLDICFACDKLEPCNLKYCRLGAYYKNKDFYSKPAMCNY